MQTLAAYSFKSSVLRAEAENRFLEIQEEIDNWLKEKGVVDADLGKGIFKSLSGSGEGRFMRNMILSEKGEMLHVNLFEMTDGGQYFTTNIRVIRENSSIGMFSNLNVSSKEDVISPQMLYPRCPKIIRKIISKYGDWVFGESPVPNGEVIKSFGNKNGSDLCDLIKDPKRNFPIIVVSVDPEEEIWGNLSTEISRDLVGLAHVFSVDEEASWEMTSILGKSDSCYLGAVRLYWPVVSKNKTVLRGKVWTPKRLRASFGEDLSGMKRFQSILRTQIMSAAALTITPPVSIRSILTSAISEKITEAERAAVDKELNEIVEENEKLRQELIQERMKNSDLEGEIFNLRKMAEKLESSIEDENRKIDDGGSDDDDAENNLPSKGDLFYYKKIGNGGGVDTLIRTDKCNHEESSWNPAFRADQAEKGILKLEGRNDWQSIQHCGACTGGGRWRVRW